MPPDTPQAEAARGMTPDESKRLDDLADAEDIVTAAYYSSCPPGSALDCQKCRWLLRVLARIEAWQEEVAAPMFPDRARAATTQGEGE
jgi:hypothetical protein